MTQPSAIKTLPVGGETLVFDSRSLRLAFLRSAPEEAVSSLVDLLGDLPADLPSRLPGASEGTAALPAGPRTPLHRLTLCVSNLCPLACRYCYAHEGCYYSSGQLMPLGVALRAVNVLIRQFAPIEHVSFFGGEPALNTPVIEAVCSYWHFLRERGVIDYQPTFGLTTSGYRLDSDLLTILKRHQFRVTVSLDGPPEIHDVLRVTKGGRGTYAAVARSLDALRDLGLEPEIECTWTGEHQRRGLDLVALMDFVEERFGCRVLHCPLVISRPEDPWFVPLEEALEIYAPAVRKSAENWLRGEGVVLSLAVRMLDALAARKPIEDYCPAGTATLTVNADGRLFSCFLLMDGPGDGLGSVLESEGGLSLSPDLVRLLDGADKARHPACRKCWARPLCFGCLGEDRGRGPEGLQWSAEPGHSPHCDLRRGLAEVVLTTLGEQALAEVPGTYLQLS